MTAVRRWWCVAIGVLLLVATPVLVRAYPAADEGLSATGLLQRIQASRGLGFTGLVETRGTVSLPTTEDISSLGALVGGSNRVRVWWRDPSTWRVATLRTTGETDLVHAGDRTLRWVYESERVTLIKDPPVRLPQTADLLPNELARRVLQGARPSEISRLPARRVAGRDALGLRLRPAEPQATIGRVDVYADRETGLPLRVELFGRGDAPPVVSTAFQDVELAPPTSSELSVDPPAHARLRYDDVVDLASAADRFAARVPPPTLAGLPAHQTGDGSVGVYGVGPTVLLAVPLWSRSAEHVREDLSRQPGARELPGGVLVTAPPLGLLLANPEPNENSWLLAGTVTRKTLVAAAAQLAAHRPGLRFP